MSRIIDWFKGGDPRGRQKIRAWATGDDGRPEGYTYSVGYAVTGLMLAGAALYPFTRGYGTIICLALAVFAMLGRRLIEKQATTDFSDLAEAQRQFGRTRNPEYLDFMVARCRQMLADNKALRKPSKEKLHTYLEWAASRQAKLANKAARKS